MLRALATALSVVLLPAAVVRAEDWYIAGACLPASYGEATCDLADCSGGCDEDEDEPCSYGPCACEPRGTLMQWSYGTSFGGGPPGYDEPLATDRPDTTEASTTVGVGVAQIEYGYTYTRDEEGGDRVIGETYPETLLRVGMFAEWLEFRIGWSYAEEQNRIAGVETRQRGAEDLYVGAKIALTPQEGILPEMAIMPQMLVPSGGSAFTNDEMLPGVNWLYGWDVTERLSVAGSTQGNRLRDDSGDFYFEITQTMTTGLGITERLSGYAEWIAFVPNGAVTAHTEHYFNGGFTFLLSNNSQLDIRAGVGLNNAADDFFWGIGHSQRF